VILAEYNDDDGQWDGENFYNRLSNYTNTAYVHVTW